MSSYYERQKTLFNQLKDAEEQYSFSKSNKIVDPPNYGEVDRRTYKKLKHEMKQFRGKESIYKQPTKANMRDCLRPKRVPDYIKNPKKWVYYSLEDVTPEQMSEKTNTATALALMQKLEDQEAAKTEMDVDSDDVIFKKPIFQVSSTIKKTVVVPDEKVVFKSNKVIMPEYVVGITKKKEKPFRKPSVKHSDDVIKASLVLNHLYEDDDEE